jgi:hypothetical protein
MSGDNGTTQGSEWDDEAFRARVAAIAQQQHRTLREVCLKAGLAHDYLAKTTYSGRNIRAIIALAGSLQVPATDLLFAEAPKPRADSVMLRHLAIVAHVAAHLYVSLGAEQHADDAEAKRVMSLIMSLIERDLEKPEHH